MTINQYESELKDRIASMKQRESIALEIERIFKESGHKTITARLARKLEERWPEYTISYHKTYGDTVELAIWGNGIDYNNSYRFDVTDWERFQRSIDLCILERNYAVETTMGQYQLELANLDQIQANLEDIVEGVQFMAKSYHFEHNQNYQKLSYPLQDVILEAVKQAMR